MNLTKKGQIQLTKYAIGTIIVIVVLVVAYYTSRSAMRNAKKKRFDKMPENDVVRLAQEYRLAMNPSGISWMKSFDGTDEEAIMNLAARTKGQLDEVQASYKVKFNTTLTDDLRDELSSDLYNRWFDKAT